MIEPKLQMILEQTPIHAHGCIRCGRSVACCGPELCPVAPSHQFPLCLMCAVSATEIRAGYEQIGLGPWEDIPTEH